jgi:fluoride ion exporter CrcB/FEX
MAIVLWIAAGGALGSALRSLDFVTLFERRAFELAGTYAAASVALSVLSIFAGLWLTRTLLQ